MRFAMILSDTPLVSVCIPAYRAERFLAETLSSVAEQTWRNWEIIVTEDGSKDATETIVREFSRTVRQPVFYQSHTENRGLPSTRNSGISAARGMWIAFLDADDLWKPNHLENALRAGARSRAELVFSGTESFDSDTRQIIDRRVPTTWDLENLPVALYVASLSILPSSVLIRREAFKKFGPVSVDFPQVNDTEYWLRALRMGGHFAYSGDVTLRYRKHPFAMSNRAAEILEDSARLCEMYSDWDVIPAGVRKSRPASLYRWAGRTILASDRCAARRLSRCALRLEPLNPRTLGLFARTFLRASGETEKRAA